MEYDNCFSESDSLPLIWCSPVHPFSVNDMILFLVVRWNSIVYMSHFHNHLSVDGHLGWPQSVAMNMCRCLCCVDLRPSGITQGWPGWVYANCMFTFWGAVVLISTVVLTNTTSSAQEGSASEVPSPAFVFPVLKGWEAFLLLWERVSSLWERADLELPV